LISRLYGSLCGLSRVDIRDEGNDGVEDTLRDGARVGLEHTDQTIARVGYNVAVNDFATRTMGANVVSDLADDDSLVHCADCGPDMRRHFLERTDVKVEQLASGNRATIAPGFGNRPNVRTKLAVTPMVALRQIGTLPVKDFAARINHDAVFGWMELENLAGHKKKVL
jgi:hypothetical protein